MGRARVIEIQNTESIQPEELVSHRIRRGERILFKTRNSSRGWQTDTFIEDFVFISKEAGYQFRKEPKYCIRTTPSSTGLSKRGLLGV